MVVVLVQGYMDKSDYIWIRAISNKLEVGGNNINISKFIYQIFIMTWYYYFFWLIFLDNFNNMEWFLSLDFAVNYNQNI